MTALLRPSLIGPLKHTEREVRTGLSYINSANGHKIVLVDLCHCYTAGHALMSNLKELGHDMGMCVKFRTYDCFLAGRKEVVIWDFE